jgi:hypothetical protein
VVLPNGLFLLGNKVTKDMAVLDPATLTWTAVPSTYKKDFNAEEGWTLMPNGTVLTFDVKNAPHAERYLPTKLKWVSAGSTIVDLHSQPTSWVASSIWAAVTTHPEKLVRRFCVPTAPSLRLAPTATTERDRGTLPSFIPGVIWAAVASGRSRLSEWRQCGRFLGGAVAQWQRARCRQLGKTL